EKYAIHLIVDRFIKENVFFDEIQTELNYNKIKKEIDPVIAEVHSGDHIIRSGFIVTAQDMEKAIVLNSRINYLNIRQISAVFLLLILIYIFSILMFRPLFQNKKRKHQYIYLLISFYLVFIFYTSVILQFNFTNGFVLAIFLPTAFFSMMIVILIGFQESIISVIILSLSLFLFSGATIPSFMFSFVTGISAAFLIRGAEKRIDLIKSAAFLALINILVLIIGLTQSVELDWFFLVILWAILNAFLSSIINLTLIPVFEHFLNIPTVFRLMELSDMNAPLFRKMVTMAPGTYGHSVAVANLADAACREIGANPLLARVGAYYHDLGKLDQPEYFIENQTEANKHDMLNPSLSVAVIKSHVKVGVERAKEMGLPFEVIDIIAQHHGSG
ncbi:MAG: HDIG domain-containing protein, partial [Spirochaetales bacterium]|nr:HDIG domain-containing protein [Spirochaetales bacterium]